MSVRNRLLLPIALVYMMASSVTPLAASAANSALIAPATDAISLSSEDHVAAVQSTCSVAQARQFTFGGDEVAPNPVSAGGFCTAPVPTSQVGSGREHCIEVRISDADTTDGQCDINVDAQRATSDDQSAMIYLPILARSGSPDDLLSEIEKRAVMYFWQEANPETGLIKDRANNFTSDDYTVSSIAAVGFGLAGLAIGDYQGWLTHEQAYTRTLTTLRFLRDRMPNAECVKNCETARAII